MSRTGAAARAHAMGKTRMLSRGLRSTADELDYACSIGDVSAVRGLSSRPEVQLSAPGAVHGVSSPCQDHG